MASSLHALHRAGIVAGAVLLLCLLLFPRMLPRRAQIAAFCLTAIMLLTTAGLNYMIVHRMEPLSRSAPNQDISALPTSDAARQSFDRMHEWSTRLESVVLLAGLATLLCFAMAGDDGAPRLPARSRSAH